MEIITLAHYGANALHYHIRKFRGDAREKAPHYHTFYQMCFVTNGKLIHHSGKGSASLGAGDAFIVPPGFSHSLQAFDANTEAYLVGFEETLFALGFPQSNAYRFLADLQEGSSGLSEKQVHLRIILGQVQRELIQNLMHCLSRQQQEVCPPGLSSAPSLVAGMLYLLSQNYYHQSQDAREYHELANYNSTLVQCIEYIDGHYREPLSPAELAKQFGLSRSVFFAVFPQFAGMPFRQYVAHKRITEAQILIRSHPDISLAQVATAVGYEDDSTFYRNFLRITGVSPSRYRDIFRNPDQ